MISHDQMHPCVAAVIEVPLPEGLVPIEFQILAALTRLEAALGPEQREPRDALLDRRQVAALLRVSTRWVERHLRPTSQPRRGGRAWYQRADVEEQMRVLRPRGAAPPPPKRRAKLAPLAVPDSEVQQRIAAIEARLRDEPAETNGESPIRSRKRGARAASGR